MCAYYLCNMSAHQVIFSHFLCLTRVHVCCHTSIAEQKFTLLSTLSCLVLFLRLKSNIIMLDFVAKQMFYMTLASALWTLCRLFVRVSSVSEKDCYSDISGQASDEWSHQLEQPELSVWKLDLIKPSPKSHQSQNDSSNVMFRLS